jgi:hypothetical protein
VLLFERYLLVSRLPLETSPNLGMSAQANASAWAHTSIERWALALLSRPTRKP